MRNGFAIYDNDILSRLIMIIIKIIILYFIQISLVKLIEAKVNDNRSRG